MYHKVAPTTPTLWWVAADAFDRQMADLAGFEVVPLDRYDPDNPKHVAITFDGVYENVFRFAFPLLRKWNYPFELFAIGDRIGRDNAFDDAEPLARFCTAEQLETMGRHGGRVQWHTRTHPRLGNLNKIEVEQELTVPDAIARRFPAPHLGWFAYPHGEHEPEIVEAVRGRFRGALSCIDGSHGDRHQLNRTTVTNETRFAASKVSIVVANYNYGRFLPEAVESVFAQTHPADEIVIIDDASTDGSRETIEAYKGRATLIFNDQNLGIVDNFRKAVAATSSDYVAILGADNAMRSDFVEKCRAALDRDPTAAIAYTDMTIFGPRGSELAARLEDVRVVAESAVDGLPIYLWRFPEPTEEVVAALPTRNFLHGSSMFRRSAYDAVGGYRRSDGPEDHDLFRRIVESGSRPVRVPHALIFYRQHSSAQANTTYLLQQENYALRSALRAHRDETRRLEERGLLLGQERDKLIADLSEIVGDRVRVIAELAAMTGDRDRLARDLYDITADRTRIAGDLVVVSRDLERVAGERDQATGERDRSIAEVQELARRLRRRSPRAWIGSGSRWLARGTKGLLRPIVRRLPAKLQNLIVEVENWSPSSAVVHSRMNTKALADLADRRSAWAANPERLVLRPSVPEVWPEIDLQIVTYNSARWLPGFFESLTAQDYPLDRLHLQAVDNSSSDGTGLALEAARRTFGDRFASFRIHRERNLGFGLGHHKAMGQGKARFVVVSNVDLTFERAALTTLVAAALSDTDDVASWEARQKPFEHPKYYDPVTGETNWCSSAFVLMRRSAYEAVGGYDPGIFMYGEDVELSYRLRRNGYILRYVPSAVVWHYAYEDAGAIKPLQFQGSTLANALMRVRYGTARDALSGVLLLSSLVRKPEVYAGSRRDVLRNLRRFAVKFGSYYRSRKPSDVAFPFRAFDYELTRDGAFLEGRKQPSDAPLVSIVIRTYKGREPILRQAMASALQQTYPNVEVVVVEDGGNTTEASVRQIEQLGGRPVRYKGLPKVGRSAAGNAGVSLASGRYVNFLDDDDLLFSDHVETLMDRLREDEGAVAAYSLAWQVQTKFEDGFSICREMMHEMPDLFRQEFSHDVLWHHNFIPIQSCLFERRLFEEQGGFDVELDALEDWNLWLRYAHGRRFVYVPKLTSLFRIPYDRTIRRDRHLNLHGVYEDAKRRAREAVGIIRTQSVASPSLRESEPQPPSPDQAMAS